MTKGLEALDNLRSMVSLSQDCHYKESNKLCDTIEKELKALEILKNKNIDLFYLQDTTELERYNDACDYYRNLSYLTQEEYDLLKETLCNT